MLIALSATTPLIGGQAPGSGWVLVPTPERTVKTLYWQLFDVTEVWTRIVPHAENGARRIPASLIFSATLKGKTLTSAQVMRPPQDIMVLAQPDPLAILPITSLSFVLITDTGQRFDLIGKGVASRLISPCDSCSAEAILARVNAEMFRTLTESKTITGNVLGFNCELDHADMSALIEFARSIRLFE